MTRTFGPGHCPLCGGDRTPGRVTFSADHGGGVVVIRQVPASVCGQCGEEWIDDAVAAELERRSADARKRGAQVEVLSMA
ncbi:MAG: type II toxin-antitoxin system MqsA family antitoxin [Deltaproteobacteria bacterium]|nr:type II toxin-antitoxin system MqsA family antitoxin [Deltaproteobacteria bacterium]